MNEHKGMTYLAVTLSVLAALLVVATVVCGLLACWVVGDNSARWANTAFIGFICLLATGGGAALAWAAAI